MPTTKNPKPNNKSKANVPKSKSQTLVFGKTPKFWAKLILVTIAILLPLILIFDGLIGGNMNMYSKWIECGRKPVALIRPGFRLLDNYKGSGGVPSVPSYAEPYNLTLVQPREFYCTPYEAEMHGYSASKDGYKFEHLTQEEHDAVYERYLKP